MNLIFNIRDERFLKLSDSRLQQPTLSKYPENDWPCNPRGKPSLHADTAHDLPGFNQNFGNILKNLKINILIYCIVYFLCADRNLIDWSVNDEIVTSIGDDIFIWNRSNDMTMVYNVKEPCSLAYCPKGRYLAIGCKACEYPGE